MYIYVCMYVYTHIEVSCVGPLCICIYTYIYTNIYMYIYIYMYICIYVYIYTCIYMYICIYICFPIHIEVSCVGLFCICIFTFIFIFFIHIEVSCVGLFWSVWGLLKKRASLFLPPIRLQSTHGEKALQHTAIHYNTPATHPVDSAPEITQVFLTITEFPCKRALYFRKRALYTRKRALLPPAKEPCSSTKEPSKSPKTTLDFLKMNRSVAIEPSIASGFYCNRSVKILSFFRGWRRPNLISGLSRWWAPDESCRTKQESRTNDTALCFNKTEDSMMSFWIEDMSCWCTIYDTWHHVQIHVYSDVIHLHIDSIMRALIIESAVCCNILHSF